MVNQFQIHYKFCIKFIFLINLVHLPSCYSLNVRNGQKWPSGVVKYKLDETFTLKDISEFKKAFEEYHTRTCIRFQPWVAGNPDYVIAKVINAESGRTQACKVGGHQQALFGYGRRTMAHIILLLGYALCIVNENRRMDRDDYLNFPDHCDETTQLLKDVTSNPYGIYDYSSIFHASCNNCLIGWPTVYNLKKCGEGRTSFPKLSVLDGINALYNCQGCHRHRWILADSLAHKQKTDMHSFGYSSSDGSPIYPCRVVYNGEVTLGSFNVSTKGCHISYGLKAYEVMNNVEVLTIPAGLEANCSIYKLVNRQSALLKSAVTAGASFFDRRWRGYIAYGSLVRRDGVKENAVGKVWILNLKNSTNDNENEFPNRLAELAVGPESYSVENYKILTCSKDVECMLEKLYLDRIK